MGYVHGTVYLLDAFMIAREMMSSVMRTFAGNNAVVARQTGPEAICERFMKMRPKEFSGTTDPLVAEGWIKSLEVIFEFMELGDEDRLLCATYMFGRNARLWWEGASVALDLATLRWTRFTEAPHRPPQQQHQSKKPFHGSCRSRGQQQQGHVVPRASEYPICVKCTRRHTRTCMYGSGKCYKCGSPDHILKNCPQKNLPTQGRVFALHAVETNTETMLLTGRIFIAGSATNALIDSGATHSFISETFVNYLKVKTIGLDIAYSVVLPSGEELTATNVVRDIDFELHGNLVYADLIVLPMPEFDIILGMDWLLRNIILIDFQRRSVLVRPLGREQFLFEPDRKLVRSQALKTASRHDLEYVRVLIVHLFEAIHSG
ncbi:uncharacterized protein [Primulina huaijiensis]|uniref:uncharacterized protein n=1 Tax=Primulina huaijiensis TaxID=1492673 RepID=UPI003CC7834F